MAVGKVCSTPVSLALPLFNYPITEQTPFKGEKRYQEKGSGLYLSQRYIYFIITPVPNVIDGTNT